MPGHLHSRPILAISEKGSFDKAQLNFVTDFVTLLAAKSRVNAAEPCLGRVGVVVGQKAQGGVFPLRGWLRVPGR